MGSAAQPNAVTVRSGADDFFLDATSSFDMAAAAAGLQSLTLTLAGRAVQLRFAGAEMRGRVLAALGHLPENAGQPDLTIDVFDAHSTGVPLPRAVWSVDEIGPRGVIPGLNTDRYQFLIDRSMTSMSCIDLGGARAVFMLTHPDELPYWQMAFPLRQIVAWWSATFDALIVHAAAVGDADGAVLIPGNGGLGKSSTALSCLLAGMGFLGDDSCLVQLGQPTRVHALYSAAKLLPDALDRMPEFAPLGINVPDHVNTKVLVPLGRHFAAQMLQSAPVVAIAVPRRVDTAASLVAPGSSASALKALAPNSMLNIVGDARSLLRANAAIARSAPVFDLALGTDRAGVVDAVRSIIDQVRG